MSDIEKNKINKNDTKEKIREKINNCNNQCIEYLKKYEGTIKKLDELKEVENNIPEIKDFIGEYITKPENSINKIEEIKKYYNELFIKRINEETKKEELSIKENIKDTENKLNKLYNKIFIVEDNERKTIDDKLSDILAAYKNIISEEDSIKNKIETYYNKELPQTQEKIKTNFKEIENYKNECIGTNDEDENSIKYKILSFYNKILNYNNKVFIGSEKEKSIKSEIEELIAKTKDNEEKREKIYKNTKNELDSLLPDAGSVGLAYDYNKAKQDYGLKFNNEKDKETDKYVQKFAFWKTTGNMFSPYFLFLAPLITIIVYNVWFNKIDFFSFKNLFINCPLLLISIFGNRIIVLRRRMYEEYNHKEKVLKMFSSLRDELKNDKIMVEYCDESGNKRKMTQYQRLIEIVLNTVEYNPSKILGVKNESFLSELFNIKELKLKIRDLELQLNTYKEKNQ